MNRGYEVNAEAVMADYFANDGDYDWKTGKGKAGKWKMTLSQIRKKYGFRSDSNVLDRVRTRKLPTRSAVNGRPTPGRRRRRADEIDVNGDVPRQYRLAKSAASAHLVKSAIGSPRVIQVVHAVVMDLARAFGTEAPTLAEVTGFIGKVMR